jgi:DNA-binding NarL/FixJ family response regulator
MIGPSDLHVLLATIRPAVRSFFETLDVRVAPIAGDAPPETAAGGDVAVVDVALDPLGATDLCRRLHEQLPKLPIVALVCCPQALAPWNLRGLFAVGVSSVIDLRANRDDTRIALLSAARGETVLQVQLSRGGAALLQDVFSVRPARRQLQFHLLELVALGLPDHEIGRRLHLSPHTVKHSIESLWTAVGVRNRTELAAWAGRNGFYETAGSGPSNGPRAGTEVGQTRPL